MEDTWFCPVTDSMRINAFLKANGLLGKTHRPDWHSLKRLGDPGKIRQFLTDKQIQRIVLLEDFVGTGTQLQSIVPFAATILPDIDILVVPLIVCDPGDQVGHRLANKYENISYDPVVVIPSEFLIRPDAQPGEPASFEAIRRLITQVSSRLHRPAPDPESRRYHGYKGTGAVVVLYSNCPDNSLPIIHDDTRNWDALFPRVRRA